MTDVERPRGHSTRETERACRLPSWRLWPLFSIVIAFVVASLPVLGSANPASADQVSDLQAKASQIEQEVNAANQQIALEGQRYDQAEDQISTLDGQIAATQAQIDADTKKVSTDKSTLQKVAINAYIESGTIAQSDSLFTGNEKTYAAEQEYGEVATGNLDVAVANLHSAQVQLNAAKSNLSNQEQQAQAAADAAKQAEANADAQQQQLNGTLSQVKGQIATLVAQEQAAAAAAAAAQARQELAAAQQSAASSAADASYPPAPAAGGAGEAVAAAESQIGVPYVWGGTSPRGTPGDASGGFDCSGLVMWAWGQAGVQLPHYSGSQFEDTTPVSVADMEPGDILFYGPGGDEHEAMYVGGGQMIEAPYTGVSVWITSIRLDDGFAGVHRV